MQPVSFANATSLACCDAGNASAAAVTTAQADLGVPEFQAWALLLFALSLVTAFGNMLVVLSITREKSLQTVTNYFIISLAVADIMVGVCVMPFEIYMEMWNGVWTLPISFCDAYLATDVGSSTASILNLAAISIDRFVAVTQPIKYAKQRNQPRVFGMIAISWLISIGVALPLAVGVNEDPNRNPADCQINNPDFLIYSSMCSFYIPCVIILGLYGRIFYEIRQRSRKKESCAAASKQPGGAQHHKQELVHQSKQKKKKHLRVTIESENLSTVDEPPTRQQNSSLTNENETSEEQRSLSCGRRPVVSTDEVNAACCQRSVSELSFSNSFLLRNAQQMHVSRTASFELYENAFTDMDYVDEIDSPPAVERKSRERFNNSCVLQNAGASLCRSPELTVDTVKEECNGLLKSDKHLVTANHHAVVTFDSPATPASASTRLLQASSYCSPLSHDSDSNEEKALMKSSPSCKTEHSRFFRSPQKKSEVRRDRNISRERKVTKVMIIVLACFLACWMPFFCLNLINAFCLKYGITSSTCHIERQLFIALTWLGYINSSLNPLIYCWQNREFRKAFHRLLTCNGQASNGRRYK